MAKQNPPKCRVHQNMDCIQKEFGYKRNMHGEQVARKVWACPECNEYLGPIRD